MLRTENIYVSFDGKRVLEDMSIDVADNEIVAILGPSGIGKSTLLRVITGLIIPDSGSVFVDGKDITHTPTHLRNIGMVFQDNQLFPHMNVERNIEFGLKMLGVTTKKRHEKVNEMLELVGLVGFNRRSVGELSGGEAKRTALARSLAPQPSIVLLDEPLTGLDRELHDQLTIDLGKILRESRTTAVLVTHDREEAATIADRIVSLSTK